MPLKPDSALRKDDQSARGVKLQHRHFAFIAGVIRQLPAEYRDEVAMAFIGELKRTNKAFDATRFQLACRSWED